MQTVYYQTSNFIRHTGNLVDLGEYRAKLEQIQRDSLARQPEEPCGRQDLEEREEPGFRPVVLTMSRAQRRRARRARREWTLDAWASLAVVVMTLSFALRVML